MKHQLAAAMQPQIREAQIRYKILEAAVQKAQAAAAAEPMADKRRPLTQTAVDLAHELAALHVPVAPRLAVDDVTPERLASLLRDHRGRLGVLSSEGDIVDIIAGRYSKTGDPNFGVFLKGELSHFSAFPVRPVSSRTV
jgi:hypothetical protein